MQMLKKLFNSNSKYYLELDEIKESEVVQTAVKTAEKAVEVVKEKASEVANSEPVKEAVKTAGEVQDKLSSGITEEKPAETKSAKSAKPKATAKTKSNKSKQNGRVAESSEETKETKKTAPTLEKAGASSFEQPFWVAAMYNNSSTTNSNGKVGEQTFATDNLMPTMTKYRRRPGGSLNQFKAMAKQAKSRKG
ncbi:MAG TPA: hypothetical protein V6C71_22245 [Coleofasciculaceae cyanobacterium]|jgi:hypothetical protein